MHSRSGSSSPASASTRVIVEGRSSFKMAVLGIDAAWTLTQPSGVALVAKSVDGWRLVCVEPSYQRFHAGAHGLPPEVRPSGSEPKPNELLLSALKLCGRSLDLVAVDMPLARTPIAGRRASDDAVSRAYGARKAGTHTPSATRPGRISDNLRSAFEAAGYRLLTRVAEPPGMIEVYPHPALVELTSAEERLRYKASKVRNYWRHATTAERRDRLYAEWFRIVFHLEREIIGVKAALPIPSVWASGLELKTYEDMLDAVVYAWVGMCTLEGRAIPYGDDNSAIWISTAPAAAATRP
jgi:predicted RNase H-like nuclease